MPLRQHGFTLLESMIVIAIMAILVSVALPSLVDAQNSNRVDSVQRDLLSVMNQGRTQAVNEGDRISLCGSSDGLHCDNDWSGWVLFRGTPPADSETAVEPLFVGSAGSVPMTACCMPSLVDSGMSPFRVFQLRHRTATRLSIH